MMCTSIIDKEADYSIRKMRNDATVFFMPTSRHFGFFHEPAVANRRPLPMALAACALLRVGGRSPRCVMFRRKLKALEYHHPENFDVNSK